MAIDPQAPKPTSHPLIFVAHAPEAPWDDAARKAFNERMQEASEHYIAFSKYPPWSRPYDGGNAHLVEWNTPVSHSRALSQQGEGSDVQVELSLDRMAVHAGVPVRARVAAYRERNGAREPLAFDVLGHIEASFGDVEKAGLSGPEARDAWRRVASLAFEPDPADATGARVASFTPASIAELAERPREAEVVAVVTVGERQAPLFARFRYAVEDPITIHRLAEDRIDGGSLLVAFDAEVRTPGRTRVTAGLRSTVEGRVVAVFDDYVMLDRGRQRLSIRFFGKAIHDSKADGPYEVVSLHGHIASDRAADVPWMASGPFTTRDYRAVQFSDQEWDGPERAHKIEQYDRVIGGM